MPNPTPKFSNWVVRGDFRQGLIFALPVIYPLRGHAEKKISKAYIKTASLIPYLVKGKKIFETTPPNLPLFFP